jgi:hypothetical protein
MSCDDNTRDQENVVPRADHRQLVLHTPLGNQCQDAACVTLQGEHRSALQRAVTAWQNTVCLPTARLAGFTITAA